MDVNQDFTHSIFRQAASLLGMTPIKLANVLGVWVLQKQFENGETRSYRSAETRLLQHLYLHGYKIAIVPLDYQGDTVEQHEYEHEITMVEHED